VGPVSATKKTKSKKKVANGNDSDSSDESEEEVEDDSEEEGESYQEKDGDKVDDDDGTFYKEWLQSTHTMIRNKEKVTAFVSLPRAASPVLLSQATAAKAKRRKTGKLDLPAWAVGQPVAWAKLAGYPWWPAVIAASTPPGHDDAPIDNQWVTVI